MMCTILAAVIAAQTPAALDRFITGLGQPQTQWLSTAHLQQYPAAAIPRLLEPGRAMPAPHDRWTPALLTLAKIGEPAIPALVARLETIRRNDKRDEASETFGLIKVLAAIGPAAVPHLVHVGETRSSRSGCCTPCGLRAQHRSSGSPRRGSPTAAI